VDAKIRPEGAVLAACGARTKAIEDARVSELILQSGT
jgi:hypothetical protein